MYGLSLEVNDWSGGRVLPTQVFFF